MENTTSSKRRISLLAKRIVLAHNRNVGVALGEEWFLLFPWRMGGQASDWRSANEGWYRECGSLTVHVEGERRLTWAEAQRNLDAGVYGPTDRFQGPSYTQAEVPQ